MPKMLLLLHHVLCKTYFHIHTTAADNSDCQLAVAAIGTICHLQDELANSDKILLMQVSYMKILHGILSDSKIQGVKAFQPVQHFCMTVTKDLLAKLVKSSTEDAPDLKGGSVAGDLDATNGSIEENQSTTEGKNKACSEVRSGL